MTKSLPYIFFTALLLFAGNVFTSSSGIYSSLSGSPLSNGNTCSNCHSGGLASSQSIEISTNIPASGFEENTDYTIKIKAKGNGGVAVNGGFNTTIESQSMYAGAMQNLTGGGAQTTQNVATHTFANNYFSGDSLVWQFTWNSGMVDDAKIYTAVNFANGNGNTFGDAVKTSTLMLTKSTLSTPKNVLSDFGIFPNPAHDFITISCHLRKESSVRVKLFDLQGRLVAELMDEYYTAGSIKETLQLPNLSAGNYLLSVSNEDENHTEQILIR